MSALGHKRTCRAEIAMSALPPKADIRPGDQDVCFGPDSDIRRIIRSLRRRALLSQVSVRVSGPNRRARSVGQSSNNPEQKLKPAIAESTVNLFRLPCNNKDRSNKTTARRAI